jgi:tetratricopeptide (TPR) repeat protein
MATRLYLVGAALFTLGLLLYAADRRDYVRLPWRAAPEAGLQSATLRATWTVDLETGNQGTPRADLHWGMQARDQPYLGVFPRGSGRPALIAEAGAAKWEQLDEAALAKLNYSASQHSAWGPEAPVRKGAVFGVRTTEGNLAKVRIAEIRGNSGLRLEWVLFQATTLQTEKTTNPNTIPPGPSLNWQDARDEALAAYKAQRYQEALDACGRAVEGAEKAGAEQHALALASCGGLLALHRRASKQIEAWLKQGAAIAMKLEQRAIVAALGPREAMLKERSLRMLGVFYRDQNRPREAAEAFARAVDTVRALAPPETEEHRLALRGDLHELGAALAKMGLRGTARHALGEARELYLKDEPNHLALKDIDSQLQRLEPPRKEPEN